MIDERSGWKPPLEGKVSTTGWKNDSWLTPSGGCRHDCYDLINDNHCNVDLALTIILNHCFHVVGCNHDIHGGIRVILVHINIKLQVDSLS